MFSSHFIQSLSLHCKDEQKRGKAGGVGKDGESGEGRVLKVQAGGRVVQ